MLLIASFDRTFPRSTVRASLSYTHVVRVTNIFYRSLELFRCFIYLFFFHEQIRNATANCTILNCTFDANVAQQRNSVFVRTTRRGKKINTDTYVEKERINFLRWNDMPRTSRTVCPIIASVFTVLCIFKYNPGETIIINLLLVNNFYPVTTYRRVQKESDELLYTVWSFVMVRNQLPAQVVKLRSPIVFLITFSAVWKACRCVYIYLFRREQLDGVISMTTVVFDRIWISESRETSNVTTFRTEKTTRERKRFEWKRTASFLICSIRSNAIDIIGWARLLRVGNWLCTVCMYVCIW